LYFIGYDIGSSSVKASLLDGETNQIICSTSYPPVEMEISAPQTGWAEQDPDLWWEYVVKTTKTLLAKSKIDPYKVSALGISYQMHGLVIVDHDYKPLRPAIIWCDSRAISIGEEAAKTIGIDKSLEHHLNTPGNFTASKLAWVRANEPETYEKIAAFMLPGDYIVTKMTEWVTSTISGFSEGILWDFKNHLTSDIILDAMDIDPTILAPLRRNIGNQGKLAEDAAKLLGLPEGTPITYRAGDQPNNALSLGVTEPGQIAATGGTSGVVYGVLDKLNYDPRQRVNSFAHVNHEENDPRIGVLLCINGAGIAYGWMKNQVNPGMSYEDLSDAVDTVPIGCDGLVILPFGNGSERMLDNKQIGSCIHNLDFNRHKQAHLYRATLEGIAYAYVYGMSILKEMGINVNKMKVGNDNLFQSAPFSNTIATLMNCEIEVIATNGAAGAARGAAIGYGTYELQNAFDTLETVQTYSPNKHNKAAYQEAYDKWYEKLNIQLENH